MAKRKSTKKGPKYEFDPNPFDGFRATSREMGGEIEIYMSVTGGGEQIEDAKIANFDDDDRGHGKADVAFLLTQALAVCLNAGLSLNVIEDIVRNVVNGPGEKYRVTMPRDWFFQTSAGICLDDYQLIYGKKDSSEIVVVAPDEYTDHTTLDDIVHEGRQNIVAPGVGNETPKLQHQDDFGEEEGSRLGQAIA